MAGDSKAERRYQSTVERSLSLFDPSSEWADYIAFLGRLGKAISGARPEGVSEIPLKALVAKCLSQCLQPTLPSGVHQKALEVYDMIFSIIESEGLSKDLSLYLPGLSHTLAFANLSTRPMILDLYEKYVLKLTAKVLRPGCRAIILSLLPALEEETSEDFERTLNVFDGVRNKFQKDQQESFFWQTLFVASILSSNRRPGVLVYLTRYLPKLQRTITHEGMNGSSHGNEALSPEAEVIVAPEPGLLVRCFATGLCDEQPLVQRGFLDLLVSHIPLNAPIFCKPSHTKDVDVLVKAAAMVVLRRDMGLNRRLWAWFTGSEGKPAYVTSPVAEVPLNPVQSYFEQFGLAALIRSIQEMIAVKSLDPADKARPFRVALSLMDRWDIGGPVVACVFLPLLRSLQTYQASAPSQAAFDEVFRSANVFFDGVESGLVFDQLSLLLDNKDIDLISFIISNFNLEETEILTIHLPPFCLSVAKKILEEPATAPELTVILNDLLATIPSLNQTQEAKQGPKSEETESLLGIVAESYLKLLGQPQTRSNLLLLSACFERCMLLDDNFMPLSRKQFGEQLLETLKVYTDTGQKDFFVPSTAAKLVSTLKLRDIKGSALLPDLFSPLLHLLVQNLWPFLKPSSPQFHVSATEDIWRLHELFQEYEFVESIVLSHLVEDRRSERKYQTDKLDHFAIFWTHSRSIKKFADNDIPDLLATPFLHILDTAVVTNSADPARRWLLGLPTLSSAINIALSVHDSSTQSIALALTRIDRLVRLLRTSNNHWAGFVQSPELQNIWTLCMHLLTSPTTTDLELKLQSLSLVREIYQRDGGAPIPQELVAVLVDMLPSDPDEYNLRAAMLDTLLAVAVDEAALPKPFLHVLLSNIARSPGNLILDKEITLLCNTLPSYSTLLPNLLKITETFCTRIKRSFEDLQELYTTSTHVSNLQYPERSIINLLSGMEYVLARAHQQVSARLDGEDGATGASNSDLATYRAFANDHLTVVLCMQDAVKTCAQLWLWRSPVRIGPGPGQNTNVIDPKSFQYMALKLRSRTRRILENLIEAEPQECLETLIAIWIQKQQPQVLDLLQTLDGARPKFMMPAAFNAIYSRTNPTALDQSQKSSLSVELRPLDLIAFLNDYTTALEDDLLEEIWTDCTTFLREVLANPMPHRQILVKLLEFNAVVSRKMENTNFGEVAKMRRELADLCARLFTAIFTIKPAGLDVSGAITDAESNPKRARSTSNQRDSGTVLQTFSTVLPDLSSVLTQTDRLAGVCSGIATHITGPSVHAKVFPQNITPELLDLLKWLSTVSSATKSWKKDAADSFNNPRFFQNHATLATGWLTLIRQLSLSDKNMMPELIARIAAPAAAGLMFGVGATAARNEADRRTQLDLRRICVLLLSADQDSFGSSLRHLLLKMEELSGATPESSPSLATRGDIYLVFRALLLCFNPEQLTLLWPLLDSELRNFCNDIMKKEPQLNEFSRMQGAKLLDLLLLLQPDEFQLHEWLFVTDTIDAVYPPSDVQSVAYADSIAIHLHSNAHALEAPIDDSAGPRKPWLCGDASREADKSEALLAGFFSHLSIRVFEDVYTLRPVDKAACRQDLLADLFNDGSPN